MASEVRTYRRSESAVFFKTREAFGELSNMRSGYSLVVSGIAVPSSEALYQACRFPHMPEVQKKVIEQASPMTAKMVSKPYRAETREDWDAIRVAVMKWCLRIKLAQHWKEFGDVLLRTGDRPIVEQSRKDPFWGAIPDASGQTLRGANVLGRLLMELRDLLVHSPATLHMVKPVPVEAFCLLGKPIEPIKVDAKRKIGGVIEPLQHNLLDEPRPHSCPQQQQLAMFDALPKGKASKKPEKQNYHVIANSQRGGWDVWREGGKRASGHFRTKAEAVEHGRTLARNQSVELVQHTKEASQRAVYSKQQSWLRM